MTDESPDNDLDESMAKLAKLLADDARDPTTEPETRVDIFKALTTYYLGSKKRKVDAPPKNGANFGAMREKITQAGGVGHG